MSFEKLKLFACVDDLFNGSNERAELGLSDLYRTYTDQFICIYGRTMFHPPDIGLNDHSHRRNLTGNPDYGILSARQSGWDGEINWCWPQVGGVSVSVPSELTAPDGTPVKYVAGLIDRAGTGEALGLIARSGSIDSGSGPGIIVTQGTMGIRSEVIESGLPSVKGTILYVSSNSGYLTTTPTSQPIAIWLGTTYTAVAGSRHLILVNVGGVSGTPLSSTNPYLFKTATNLTGGTTVPGQVMANHTSGTGFVYANGTDGSKESIGLCKEGSAAGSDMVIQVEGIFSLADWTPIIGAATLSPLTDYFISTVNGQLIPTILATAGNHVQLVGHAISPTELELKNESICIRR